MSVEYLKRLREDFPLFAKVCLRIEDKDGRLVPFVLNDAQWILWREVKFCLDNDLPCRLIVLKGRQQGCSTFFQGLSVWLTVMNHGFRCMTIAQDLKPSAQELFGKVELMVESLPPELHPGLAPGRMTGRRLKFDKPNRSLLVVETAEKRSAVGRSGTYRFGHMTELPLWPYPDETISAFESCIPDKPFTFLIAESTAMGMGDWFHTTWVSCISAKRDGRRPDYTPVFIPWFKQREYRRKRTSIDAPLSSDELKRQKRFKLDDEQLLWYRDKEGKSGELVKQEYPDCWEDAFLSSGRPYFLQDKLSRAARSVREPLSKRVWVKRGKKYVCDEHEGSGLWIWYPPERDHDYVVSVDASTGRAKDFSAYHVLDVTDEHKIRQCAVFHGKVDIDDLTIASLLTARWYNMALWSPERNNHGEHMIIKCREIGYPRVYRHRVESNVKSVLSNELGFTTSKRTRPIILEGLAEFIHNDLIEINDLRTLKELQSFVFVDDSGTKAEAAAGSNDDLVMSLAIGVAARKQARGRVEVETW